MRIGLHEVEHLLVIALGMIVEDLGHIDRQGTVDKNRDARYAPLVDHAVEEVDQRLRASYGEGGDDDDDVVINNILF